VDAIVKVQREVP